MLTIDQVKKLPDGISGITFEGKVGYIGEPKHKTGTSQAGKDYDFWSQFITVTDDTETVGVSIAVDQEKLFTEADKTRKVKITNGKVREYKDNKGVDKKEIRAGKIEFLDTQKKTMNDTKESSVKRADDGERWLEKDRQIAGQTVAKSLIEAGFSEPTEQTLDWATAWCVWIDQMRQGEYNGQTMEELQRKQDVVVPESEAGATGRDDKIKRIHILKGKLEDDGYWVEDDYRLWLADEFEVQNSKDLTDEQKTKAIEILAKWLNERLKREE